MTDLDLLTFGCVVAFIAAAGGYVYMREQFYARPAQERVRTPRRARPRPGRRRAA